MKKIKNAFNTQAEVETAIARVGELKRQIASLEKTYGDEIAKLKSELSEAVAPLEAEIQALSEGIKFFMDRFREKYFSEDKKSLSLPVGTVGYRSKPPSVAVPRKSKNQPDVIETIIEMNELGFWIDSVRAKLSKYFLRQKLELDKEAILANPSLAFERTGLTVEKGKERFYIKPEGLDLEVEI